MLKPYLIPVLMCSALASTLSYAAAPTDNPLFYRGQPINPLCFHAQEAVDQISLNACERNAALSNLSTSINKDLISQGFIGFDYQWKDNSSSGYSYYKIAGNYKNHYTIFTLNSGGGSGNFTELLLVKRVRDRLILTPIASGDRANGGVINVAQSGNEVQYSVNLTPYDLVKLTGNSINLRPYQDLDACAACYAATANYRVNLNEHPLKPTLDSITLLDSTAQNSNPNATHYQKCFNQLVDARRGKASHTLSATDIKSFTAQFIHDCVYSL